MNKLFKFLLDMSTSIGRARAAAELTRRGMTKQARELMLQD